MGFIGERSPFGGSYSTPDIDINYGIGNRIQLKYEVPLGIAEMRGDSSHVAAGLGNSLLGVKYRFYQRHSKTRVRDGEREVKFSLSAYPQLLLNHPTRAVARDIAEPAPQLLLPLEANANYGWIRISGEVGYWITGEECSELVDSGQSSRVTNSERIRSSTWNSMISATCKWLRERRNCEKPHWASGADSQLLKGTGSVLSGWEATASSSATPSNGQPTWIAYVGLQFLSDKRRRHGDE